MTDEAKMAAMGEMSFGAVIIPFFMGSVTGLHAACFSFIAGVIPPMAMFGRSLL